MEIEEVIGLKLFESETYGGWKILQDKLIPTIRSEKVCAGIIEVIKMGETDKIHVAGSLEIDGWHRLANEVLFTDGVSTAVTCQSNNLLKKIVEVKKIDYFQVPQTVRVRKYPVDTKKLCKLLREHKVLTNNELAEKLGVPLTKVEHWFRQDSSFAIPDENIWFKLKDLLNIQTNEFDESIMTFVEKPGVFEKGERIYNTESIAPTVLAGDTGEKIIEIRKMNDNKTNFLGSLHGHGQGYAGAVFDSNDLAPTLTTMQGGGREPHTIEVEKLGNIYDSKGQNGNIYSVIGISPSIMSGSTNNKKNGGIGSNNSPKICNVEKLGHLEKGTGEHQSNIIYNSDGLSPCVCAGMGVKQQPTMTIETKIIGSLDENSNQRQQVYDKDGVAPTLQAAMGNGGGNVPLITTDKQIVAMRGRNPENPSDRTAGIHLEQRLEPNSEGISNTLTSVQKDNLVLEKKTIKIRQATKDGFIECEIGGVCDLNYPDSQTRRGRVQEDGQVSPTLTTESVPSLIELADPDFYNFLYEIDGEIYLIRIRKLTPRECGRLMGVLDEDISKILEVESNSQAYKAFGNSIVTNVLTAIFGQMITGKEEVYKGN